MIALGTSLREARERRGVDLEEIEAETRIRAEQLLALEAERFDKLPARVYARAFLREYAEFLGLDSDQFVAEFDARFPVVDESPVLPIGLPQPWRLPRHTGAVATLAAIAALAVLGWRIEKAETPHATFQPRVPTQPARQHAPKPTPRHARARPTLVLVAARGRCWLEVHAGSRDGRLIYRGTLEQDARLRLPVRQLWLRVGAPWNLDARLRGKPVELPNRIADLVVKPNAVQIVNA